MVEAVVILALAAAVVEECSFGSVDHCRMKTMKRVEDTEGEGEIPWWWEEGEE